MGGDNSTTYQRQWIFCLYHLICFFVSFLRCQIHINRYFNICGTCILACISHAMYISLWSCLSYKHSVQYKHSFLLKSYLPSLTLRTHIGICNQRSCQGYHISSAFLNYTFANSGFPSLPTVITGIDICF